MAKPVGDLRTDFETDREGLAYCLSMTQPMLSKLVPKGLPRRRHGVYDVAECVAWYIRYSGGSLDPEMAVEKDRAQVQLIRAQTKRTQIQAGRAAAELLPAADVQDAVMAINSIYQSAQQNMPARLVRTVREAETEAIAMEILDEYQREILDRVAAGFEQLAADPASLRAPDEAETEAIGSDVGG